MFDTEWAIGPKFIDVFTIIYTADSQIIYSTFQIFYRKILEKCTFI